MHDLLQDSWRRAHAFGKQYEALLRQQGAGRLSGSLSTSVSLAELQLQAGPEGVSLQPLVDEVCCSHCGATSELQDKLRSEEAKRTITGGWGAAHDCRVVPCMDMCTSNGLLGYASGKHSLRLHRTILSWQQGLRRYPPGCNRAVPEGLLVQYDIQAGLEMQSEYGGCSAHWAFWHHALCHFSKVHNITGPVSPWVCVSLSPYEWGDRKTQTQ